MSVYCAVTLGALWFAASPSRAAEPEARVHLTLPACDLPQLSSAQLQTAIALELGSSGLSLVPASDDGGGAAIEASVHANCAEAGTLELLAAWGSHSGSRSLELSELPGAARPRAVALALAELLAALRPEETAAPLAVVLDEEPATPSTASPNAAASSKAPPAPATRAAAPGLAPGTADAHDAGTSAAGRSGVGTSVAAPARSAITFKGEVRSFSLQPIVVGFRAGYEFNRFSLGFSFLRGSAAGNYGTLTTAIPYGYFEWRIREFGSREQPWFSFGPRLGFGLVMLTPAPAPGVVGTSTSDPFVDIAQFCQLWATVGPFRFGTQLEIGYALGAIAYETNARLANYGGPFGSALLEAAWLL